VGRQTKDPASTSRRHFEKRERKLIAEMDNIFRPQRVSPDMGMPGLTDLRLPPPVL
jgi:hypothetical protein